MQVCCQNLYSILRRFNELKLYMLVIGKNLVKLLESVYGSSGKGDSELIIVSLSCFYFSGDSSLLIV